MIGVNWRNWREEELVTSLQGHIPEACIAKNIVAIAT